MNMFIKPRSNVLNNCSDHCLFYKLIGYKLKYAFFTNRLNKLQYILTCSNEREADNRNEYAYRGRRSRMDGLTSSSLVHLSKYGDGVVGLNFSELTTWMIYCMS